MSKKKYLIQIDVLTGNILSCDECLFDVASNCIINGRYHVVAEGNNPKDAQKIASSYFSVAKEK